MENTVNPYFCMYIYGRRIQINVVLRPPMDDTIKPSLFYIHLSNTHKNHFFCCRISMEDIVNQGFSDAEVVLDNNGILEKIKKN